MLLNVACMKETQNVSMKDKAVQDKISAILENEPSFLNDTFRAKFVAHFVATAKDYEFDPFLILAVMKIESSFKTNVKSFANAYGLMQLKTVAAQEVANVFKVKAAGVKELYNPFINVKTGIQYLAFIRDFLGNNKGHILSAYNLGPYRIKKKRMVTRYAEKVLSAYYAFLKVTI